MDAPAASVLRPGALTALLAELVRAPEVAGWEQPPHPGERLGRFEIVREIGRGGFGVVYEARDHELSRSVAFKAIQSCAEAACGARALAEAEAAARLAHPNIVHLYDLGRSPRGAWLIMELLRGRSLAERLAEGPLPLREAVRVAVEVARGLAHAHAQGVVHRDLKPSNVFLCDDGQVKVLDFGLARVFGQAAVAGGTRGYMAPEQEAGQPGDERSDLFAHGVVLKELLPEKAPAQLTRLVDRLTAHDPANRPATGAEALAALLAVQRSLEPRTLLKASLAAAVLAVAGAAAFAYLSQRPLPEGQLVTAMADTDNQTGDPDLDGLSELLQSGLGQTRRLSLLGRARLVNLLRDAGRPTPGAIDAALAAVAARRAQAQLLLVPAVRRVDERYELSLRASDLGRQAPAFSVRAVAVTKATLREAADALVRETRRRLREAPGDAPAPIVPATEFAPARAEAWARYAEGQRRWSEARWDEARDAYAAALALDPEFAQARVALVDLGLGLAAVTEVKDLELHLRALRATVHRLPPRERPYAEALLLFEAPDVNGEPAMAELLAAYDRAVEAWPEDPRPHLGAARLLVDVYGDDAAARPYLEQVVALAPLQEHWAINALGALGRPEEALARARRWAEASPNWLARANVVSALHLLGRVDEAVVEARRALSEGYPVEGSDNGVVARALVDGGLADEWERRGGGRATTSWSLLRGRTRALEARPSRPLLPAKVAFMRGDAAALAKEAPTLARAGWVGWCLAGPVASLGDIGRADELATLGTSFVDRRHVCLRLYRLVRRWKTGDREGALRGLEAVVGGTALAYRGEILAELGRHREAVAAYRAARAQLGIQPFDHLVAPHVFARSLYLEAISLDRLGERDEARAVLGRLLRLWDRADPDLPLTRDMRALEKRLAGAGP